MDVRINMRGLNQSLAAVVLALLPQAVCAGIRPSFTGDDEAWRSTDIVVVSTLPSDGVFVVDEVWKGNLRPGARVAVPELIPGENAAGLSLYPNFWKNPADVWAEGSGRGAMVEQIPRQPIGSRLILFLKRKPSNSQEPQWEPGNRMGSMKASTVWVEGDQLWSFIQVINPGPSILQPTGSLRNLRERVTKVLKTQKAIESVLDVQDGTQKAQLLEPYLNSDVRDASQLALQELGKSGPAALPIIREMLDDSAYAEKAPELIKAMVEAGGAAVGPDLSHRFEREVAFWESIGPTLPPGWWNRDPSPNAPLRLRYLQTYQLIVGLEKIRDTDALASAKELDELWVSHPQLNDPSGLNQISLECERLIKLVQSN